MPNYYDIGDIIRVSSTFTDTGGSKADPGGVTFVFTAPDGTDTVAGPRTGTSTASLGIGRSTVGIYSYDIAPSSSGPHWYRFSSTGNITAMAEANFRVRRRATTT